MTFKQAMIVPTMATLGIGALLMSQNLSLVEASYAAPAAAGGAVGSMGVPGAAGTGNSGATGEGAGALPMPSEGAISAEFGPQSGGRRVTAISDAELAHRAVQSSGREDPFMALVPPDADSIVPPPVSFGPIRPVPQIGMLPPISGAAPRPTQPVVTTPFGIKPPTVPTRPVIDDIPWSGDKAPAAQEPQWLIRGIIQTKNERMTMLEGKDETLRVRVGDMLPDGSRVEAISSRGVTFLRGGRRFFKQIGGSN